MSNNLQIVFPEKQYVGRVTEANGTVLGFMTPLGDDAAFEKRKATVDSWSNPTGWRSHGRKPLDPLTIDNEAQTGFSFGNTARHGYGWNTGDTKWRVSDPRGFELEINSANLKQIMSDCTIDHDVIQEPCRWARSGTGNVLVPIHTDEYQRAVANTERKSKSASLKDLKPGDYAILQNGREGTYLGRFHPLDYHYIDGYRYHHDRDPKMQYLLGSKKHFFKDGETIFDFATPKLSEIRPGKAIVPIDALATMAARDRSPIRAVSSTKDKWGFEFVPSTLEAVHNSFEGHGDYGTYMFTHGEKTVLVKAMRNREGQIIGRFVDHNSLLSEAKFIYETEWVKRDRARYGWNPTSDECDVTMVVTPDTARK